jgi:hypothetical protein
MRLKNKKMGWNWMHRTEEPDQFAREALLGFSTSWGT